ncbi:hypothetical protein NMY22_g6212 [Coprinellus aureogranulatus]|nr:hypothetical protein NMY22_g6212 [Coprinellus aureogranulatus]
MSDSISGFSSVFGTPSPTYYSCEVLNVTLSASTHPHKSMSSEHPISLSAASPVSTTKDALLSWQARRISDLEDSLHLSENHASLLLSRNDLLRQRLVMEQQLCQQYIFEGGRDRESARLLSDDLDDARRQILTLQSINETLVDLVLRLGQTLDDSTVALNQAFSGCTNHQGDGSFIPPPTP